MDPRTTTTSGTIAALLLGGVPYVLALFLVPGLTALVFGPESAHTGATYDPSPVAATFFATAFVLVCAGFLLLWPLLRYVGLPRPATALWLLIATVGVVYLQLFVTVFLLDYVALGALLLSALVAVAFTALAVPITLAWNRGHGFRWAIAIIVAVVLVRALTDWNSYVREERERFDDVVRTVSEYPSQAALLEAEGWSAIGAWNFQDEYLQLDYEGSAGDRIEVTTWADFAADVPRTSDEPAPTDPLRYHCDTEHCTEAEESGLPVVLLQRGHPRGSHLVRLEWRPGVYVQIRAREGADLEELRVPAGRLRTAEEGDAVALTQEITEGPRR